MKRNTILFAIGILSIIKIQAQRELDSLSYENTQDINFFKNVKNNTLLKKYKTINNNIVKIGDTLILGNPTSSELNTRTNSASYGNTLRGGVSQSRSITKKTYEFIQMGRPAGFGSIMSAMNGQAPTMAGIGLKNTKVLVNEMKAYHDGSKNKPLYVVMVLGEINGRAFGINKYISLLNTELAIESGEILLKNRKMNREEAILKLKEAKELMEIDLMTKDEFEKLKKELAPIIKNN